VGEPAFRTLTARRDLMSSRTRLRVTALSAALVATVATACGPTGDQAQPEADVAATGSNRGQAYVQDPNSKPNILGIALGSEDHTTLVAAVQAAELENVLVNAGPLTVFAPVNAAFEALPAGTVEELLKPENKQQLANIITSHAAPGKFTIDLLKDGTDLYMATGHYLKVEVRDDGTYVNGSRILGSVEATNGMVHVIGEVFLVAAQ
jgi:uncharacterized surface protein with fasciclin (FAS1) repeats